MESAIMIIPKIIWQTHEYEYDNLPSIYKYTSSIWKEKSEGWEYRYVSAAERRLFIEQHFPEYLYLYDYIKPGIYKADFWRYLVLYQFGGIYADLDSVLEMNLDDEECHKLIDFNASLIVASNLGKGIYNNCCIIAAPKDPVIFDVIHSMIEKCIELYTLEEDLSGTGIWVIATGPQMYDEVIRKNISRLSLAKVPVTHCDAFKDTSDIVPKPKP
jgi:mannosyltransferase OCH1-like enzyme